MFEILKYIYLYYSGNLDEFLRHRENQFKFRDTIIRSGVVAIKLGQWLSHREDVLSPILVDTLKPLLNSVQCIHSFATTERLLQKGFGVDYRRIISYIHPDIIGSGSISQVYACQVTQLPNISCVLKIHREEVCSRFTSELFMWQNIIKSLSVFRFRFAIDIEGFLKAIESQLSYQTEFKNYKHIKIVVDPLEFIVLPKFVTVTPFCLIMTRVSGLTYQEVQKEFPEYVRDMSEKLMITYFWMVYSGYVHTDMHDGNFLYIVDEDDDTKNKIALFDFGLGFELLSSGKNGIAMMLWKAFIQQNSKLMVQLLRLILKDPPNEKQLKFQPFRIITNTKELSFPLWLEDILAQLSECHCVIQTPYMYVFTGFILLARSFIFEDKHGNMIGFDVFGSSLRAMSKSSCSQLREIGCELLHDFQKFSNESGTCEKINDKRIKVKNTTKTTKNNKTQQNSTN